MTESVTVGISEIRFLASRLSRSDNWERLDWNQLSQKRIHLFVLREDDGLLSCLWLLFYFPLRDATCV